MKKFSEYFAAIRGEFCEKDLKQVDSDVIIDNKKFSEIVSENQKDFDERFIAILLNDVEFYIKKNINLLRSGQNVSFVKEIRKDFLRATDGKIGETDGRGHPVGITPDFYGLKEGGYLLTFNGSSLVIIVQNDGICFRDAKLLI